MVRFHPDFLSIFDPVREAASLQTAVDSMLRSVLPSHGPRVNVQASEKAMHVVALVPGYSAEEIDVSIEEDRLVLRGQHSEKTAAESEPRVVARFERDFRLPFRVAHDRVQATVKNGVLEVHLPRMESDLPRRIPVLAN